MRHRRIRAVPTSRFGSGAGTFRRFPYRVVYLVHEDELVIVAYAHDRREPGYWDRRMGQ